MRKLICCFLFVFSGCAANPPKTQNIEAIMSGAWKGSIQQIITKKLPNENEPEAYEVIILACTRNIEFWMNREKLGYHQLHSDYKSEQKSGSALYYLIKEGTGWIEIQSWGLVLINKDRASLQWNRMVSNPGFSDDDEWRSFGQLGFGELRKVSEKCDVFDT